MLETLAGAAEIVALPARSTIYADSNRPAAEYAHVSAARKTIEQRRALVITQFKNGRRPPPLPL